MRHARTAKQRLRDMLLQGIAGLPLPQQGGASGRVLFVRPDHLGDMLLAMPAIQWLKRRRPELSIHLLCGPWAAEVAGAYDEIDRVLALPFPGFARAAGGATNPYRLALKTARRLRRAGYDCAFVMRPDHWWGACVVYLAGVPQRVGYDRPGVGRLLTMAVGQRHQHAVRQNMRLVEAWLGEERADEIGLRFPVESAARAQADGLLAARGVDEGRPVICIHPGAGAGSKLWSAERWAAVADALARLHGAAIVFTGVPAETALLGAIAEKMEFDAIRLAGGTTVGELAALYQRARAVLGADSGALHVAAAVGTATVALFGPADPLEFAPWGDAARHAVVTSDIDCRPCRILDWGDEGADLHPCVRDIGVGKVLAAAESVLAAGERVRA